MEHFPVGGSRQAVYDFMKNHGFLQSRNNDKCFLRADGVEAHIYGVGSMARIFSNKGKLLADAPIAEAVAKTDFRRTDGDQER